MLPNLNATADHGINQGRSIDPFTNAPITQNVDYASYGAASNLLLFNGFSLHNEIKANALGYKASKMELQQSKDNVTINIILAYLSVLSDEDILASSRNQGIVTGKQVERLDILNKAGAIPPSQYYDLKGQLANDEIAVADNQAALETAKINLVQLLNIPYDKNLELERLPEAAFDTSYHPAPGKNICNSLAAVCPNKSGSFSYSKRRKNNSFHTGAIVSDSFIKW